MFAIRMPLPDSFFEPQKDDIVISSALLKPSRRAIKTLTTITIARRTQLTTIKQLTDPSNFVPDTVNDGFAECRINYQQNGRLVSFRNPFLLRAVTNPRPGKMPQHKWQQQLQHNFADLLKGLPPAP